MEMGAVSKSIDPLLAKFEALTKSQRIILFAVVFLLMIGGFFYFSFLPKLKTIDMLGKRYQQLEAELAKVRRNAARLEMFRKKYREAEAKFKLVVRKLPDSAEIPSLLESISQSGQDVGLEFELFQPKNETNKDFYAEIPVAVTVVGGYHSVARFFDRVSRLSRIVNIQNIGMKPIKKKLGKSVLSTSCT
ncbi:type 4a pilus biogenesis protein PilO, partial [Thermodesulfobacteriota bacterium]